MQALFLDHVSHQYTYLEPLVDDLLLLWKGVPVDASSRCVRAALIAVAADLPAMRKTTQFLSHKADYGCSRYKFRAKREPGTAGASGKMSYYTPSTCEPRMHLDRLTNSARQAQNQRLL